MLNHSHTLQERLREHHLEHTLLCEMHAEIHLLVRWVTTALLFETSPGIVFENSIRPVIEKLLAALRHCYGASHPKLAHLSAVALGDEIQALGSLFHSDIEAALDNDPATNDAFEVVLCYPGCKAVRYHRIAHVFYRHHVPLLPRMIAELAHELTGIDIHPGAQIGAHFFIDHGTGVVIGESAVIGKRVTLYQGVTLGAKRIPRDAQGVPIHGEARHPILCDGVTIYSGATVLGRITIGEQSVIGGNVWLTENVSAHSRVTQQRYLSSYFSEGDGI